MRISDRSSDVCSSDLSTPECKQHRNADAPGNALIATDIVADRADQERACADANKIGAQLHHRYRQTAQLGPCNGDDHGINRSVIGSAEETACEHEGDGPFQTD